MKYLTSFLLIFSSYCYGQANHYNLLFENFRSDIKTEEELNNGVIIWDNDTKESYYKMIEKLPVKLLVNYVNDTNPSIRASIFSGLVRRKASKDLLRRITADHISDTSKFTWMSGDVGNTWTVKDFMESYIRSGPPSIDINQELKKLEKEKRLALIPGLKHNLISKDRLLRLKGLISPIVNCNIVSFVILTEREIISKSSKITAEMKTEFMKLSHGDIVVFDAIRFLCNNGTQEHFPGLVLRVQ